MPRACVILRLENRGPTVSEEEIERPASSLPGMSGDSADGRVEVKRTASHSAHRPHSGKLRGSSAQEGADSEVTEIKFCPIVG